MTRVAWLTADYFLDVDLPLVPHLERDHAIHWFLLFGASSGVETPDHPSVARATSFRSPYRARDPRLAFVFFRLLLAMRKTKADVYYLDLVGLPFFHFMAALMLPLDRTICAVHNVDDYPGWGNRRWMRFYLDWTFRTFHRFHLFSKHTTTAFRKRAPGKRVVYAPLALKSCGEAPRNRDESRIQFLFFGGIRANKNLNLLLEAFRLLPDELRCRAHLQISGSCPATDKPGYLEKAGNDPSISFDFRRIPDSEVPTLFQAHHFLVLPYSHIAQSGPQMLAYNYRLPVIATNLPGFSERITDGQDGFLFELDDPASLCDALAKAIRSHHDGYAQMIHELEARIRTEFSPEVVAGTYASFFASSLTHSV